MAHVLNDRVKETTTTTGTGTVNLAGAETGFESFVAGIGNSNTTYYCIVHQSADEFEVGIGTVTDASPDTLSRTTIISSSNSDSAVNFSAGTKDVFCTLPASKTVFFDETSGGSDVAIGSRGTNPMGLGITGTVLALTEQTNVASLQIDGNTGTRIDMGTQGSRNTVFYTDANQLEISRTTDHPIKFVINSSEVARLTSSGLQIAAGNNVSNASGDMTIDVAGDITFDAGGGDILLKDDNTLVGTIGGFASNNVTIKSEVSDGDVIIQGNDGGSSITALTLDMSAAGAATFNDNVTAYSDERLKDNIETLTDGLAKVEQLRGVTYTRDDKENIGVIAQEIEKILPEIVLTADDEMGTKSVDYSRITAVLIEAVKELSARVKELENK